ncbi:hydantoinase B/oxoprolinase family protein, partial [Bosea sp. TAB14]|uniref:hydantoinase B/oxoprolinase family protein n=1 Tax=Bosea sp. TAB14 TaxID=3237481 RepID=UPI003F8E9C83
SRLTSRPWGLAGGGEGLGGSFVFSEGVVPFVKGDGALEKGQIVEIITPGAGGYGPPAERSAEARARDRAEQRQ